VCTYVTGTLASLLVLCNTTVQEAGASCLNPLLHNMITHTELANENLSPWYFAVRYSCLALQQRINEFEKIGLTCTYDSHSLKNLQELEQFLKMSWDIYMDSLEIATSKEAVK
jgi:hypothetical protein